MKKIVAYLFIVFVATQGCWANEVIFCNATGGDLAFVYTVDDGEEGQRCIVKKGQEVTLDTDAVVVVRLESYTEVLSDYEIRALQKIRAREEANEA